MVEEVLARLKKAWDWEGHGPWAWLHHPQTHLDFDMQCQVYLPPAWEFSKQARSLNSSNLTPLEEGTAQAALSKAKSVKAAVFLPLNHLLEKKMATHSSVLAWRIPGTEEPGGLPSTGLHRVGHNWSDLAAAAASQGVWDSDSTLAPEDPTRLSLSVRLELKACPFSKHIPQPRELLPLGLLPLTSSSRSISSTSCSWLSFLYWEAKLSQSNNKNKGSSGPF